MDRLDTSLWLKNIIYGSKIELVAQKLNLQLKNQINGSKVEFTAQKSY